MANINRLQITTLALKNCNFVSY